MPDQYIKSSEIPLRIKIKSSILSKILDQQLDVILEKLGAETSDQEPITIRRSGNIQIDPDGFNWNIEIPVLVNAFRKVLNKEIPFSGTLSLLFTARLKSSGLKNIDIELELASYDWLKKPKIELAGVGISVASLANYFVEQKGDTITKDLNTRLTSLINDPDFFEAFNYILHEGFKLTDITSVLLHSSINLIGIGPFRSEDEWISGILKVEADVEVLSNPLVKGRWRNAGAELSMFENDLPFATVFIRNELEYTDIAWLIKHWFNHNQEIQNKYHTKISNLVFNWSDTHISANFELAGRFGGVGKLGFKPLFNRDTGFVQYEDFEFEFKPNKLTNRLLFPIVKRKVASQIIFYLFQEQADFISYSEDYLVYFVRKTLAESGIVPQLENIKISLISFQPKTSQVNFTLRLVGGIQLEIADLSIFKFLKTEA